MKWLRILSWAVFLGASWTWCIGMFLPVLLVRDYGIWAWVAFAIPNVVGAAAMAWVLPDAQASRQWVLTHPTACQAFSVITLAFQSFFIAWIFSFFTQLAWRDDAILFLALLLLSFRFAAAAAVSVALAVLVSLVAALWMWADRSLPHLPPPVSPTINLVWLALVCVFGFALCPYLDLTFHQARQATTPSGGRVAFAVGFGGVFLAMIVFSLAYTGWLASGNAPVFDYLAVPLGNHLLYQAGLKLILHARALRQSGHWLPVILAAFAVAMAAALGFLSCSTDLVYHGLSMFELTYRLFMSFYALIFPAYVWIVIFGKNRPSIWLAAVLIAAPMYWMAFIERQMTWLLPGVALVVLARYLRPTMTLRTTA
jgi:hypothetical protein